MYGGHVNHKQSTRLRQHRRERKHPSYSLHSFLISKWGVKSLIWLQKPWWKKSATLWPRFSSAVTHTHTHSQCEITYSMRRSLEAFGLSANSWQLRTLKPYPSQACPLISAELTVMGSSPVFSTLKVLLSVKLGSLTFTSKTNRGQIEKTSTGVSQVKHELMRSEGIFLTCSSSCHFLSETEVCFSSAP